MLDLTDTTKSLIPQSLRRWLRQIQRQMQHRSLPLKKIRRFDRLRRVTPISRNFGWDRGTPIDRYYIEQFLSRYAADIHGQVMEVQSNLYTSKFGGAKIIQSEVLDILESNPQATIIADLTDAPQIPGNQFDCIICTQTLLLIYDVRAALQTLHRLLKPGGKLLVTVPGVGHKVYREGGNTDYWRFTSLSMQKLFAEFFPPENIAVNTYGNVLTAISFLHGLATEELTTEELDFQDSEFEVTIGLKAIKPLAFEQ